MSTEKRAAAYLGLSEAEPARTWSLAEQEEQVRAYAVQQGYTLVRVYQDAVSPGKARPGFEQLSLDARSEEFSIILVAHPTCLFHHIAVAHFYQEQLRRTLGIEVRWVYDEPLDNPSGEVLEALREVTQDLLPRQHRLRAVQSKRTRAQRGLSNGTLPFGYLRGADGIPVAHPRNAHGVMLAFTAYVTGHFTDGQIAKLLNGAGYRTSGHWGERGFSKDTVNRLLKNPFYLGVVPYKRTPLPGKHPPLVDQALFDRCQAVRAQRSRRREGVPQRRMYLLAGLARCSECRLTLRGASQSRGGYRYYRHTAHERGQGCSIPSKMVRAEVIEEQWATVVALLRLPDGWWQHIRRLAGNESEAQLLSLAVLWEQATPEEQRDLTRALVRSIEVAVSEQRITALEPTAGCRRLFSTMEGVTIR